MTIFNPLDEKHSSESSAPHTSESSLMNDVQGICPKCKKPFGEGIVDDTTIYYCATCRVSQPIPA